MAYGSMPYVGMAPQKKWRPHLIKVHKLPARNVCIRLVKAPHEPYQALPSFFPWAMGPLNLLESITKVPDRQVAKTGKSSIFFLSP